MIRRLTERSSISIPKENLERVGVQPGDYFEVSDDGRRIILTPKVVDDKFSEKEWEELASLAKKAGKKYKTAASAKKHLERLSE
ncbi:MAG: AbrB/MazE/SpoVT family DNA-binding domain-containing protein [Actinobacteria bacterium]|nr:AbrB/MazE/SpoVT family DNA-binding domain-containing protein [Actinomycetota bacterium]